MCLRDVGTAGPQPLDLQVVLALLRSGIAPPGDPFAPGGLFSLSTPERNYDLVRAGNFSDVTVKALTGVMRYDSLDDYWTFVVAVSRAGGRTGRLTRHRASANRPGET